MASVQSNFNINLPLAAQPTVNYTAPAPTYNASYAPVVTPALGQDQMSTTLSSLVQPGVVGGIAGYKAPLGSTRIRGKVGVNAYGQSVRRYSSGRGGYGGSRSYGGNSRYGGGYGNSYGNNYGNSYGQRSYRSNSYGGGRSRVGSRPTFGLGAAIKSSLIWGAVASVAINGYKLLNNQESGAAAGANFAGDMVSSVVGGTAGAVAAYAGAGILAGVGLTGFMLSGAGIVAGIAGYWLADKLLRQTQLFQGFQQGAYKMFGGTTGF